MPDNERADYGLTDDDVQFEVREDDWLNVDNSFEGIRQSPINQTLWNFKNEYVKNERLAFEMFNQLNYFLEQFSAMMNSNPYYSNMDIVRLMDSILDRYKNWMTTMRYNVNLAKEKMIEVDEIVKNNYQSLLEIDDMKQEMALKLRDLEIGWNEAVVKQTGETKKIIIPRRFKDINVGDIVRFKKGDLQRVTRLVEESEDTKEEEEA